MLEKFEDLLGEKIKRVRGKRPATLLTPGVNKVYANATNSTIALHPVGFGPKDESSTNKRKAISMWIFSLLLLVGLNGCAFFNCCFSYRFQSDQGAVHYVILGIGIVTVPNPNTDTAILATRVHALGLHLSDQPGLKMAIGYSSSNVVMIPDGAEDVRVEISQTPAGLLEIDTQSARLKKK